MPTQSQKHEVIRLQVAFRRGRKDAWRAAKFFRERVDTQIQIEALKELPKDLPFAREFVTGISFPRNWGEVFARVETPTISRAQKAISWFSAIAVCDSSGLQQHVAIRTALTHSVLHGDWETAGTLLQTHQNALGPSLWALRWLMLIAEENDGPRGRRQLRESFSPPNVTGIVSAFAGSFGVMVDKALPEQPSVNAIRGNLKQLDHSFLRFMELFLLEEYSAGTDLVAIFDYAEMLPLVDRYETFLRLATFALEAGDREKPRIVRAIARIAQAVSDPSLTYLSECAGPESLVASETNIRIVNAWDSYTSGAYERCYEISKEIAERSPELLQAHELLVKSAMYLGRADSFVGTTPLALLWQHMRNVFAKSDQTEDSLNYLRRFATRFRILSLTIPLRALHAQHSSPYPDDVWSRRASFAATIHGPRNFEHGYPLATNSAYLERCAEAFHPTLSFPFFAAVLHATKTGDALKAFLSVPEIRRVFFSGLAAARRPDIETAIHYFNLFLHLQTEDSKGPLSPFAIEEARRSLVEMYRIKGDALKMQETVVQAYLERPQSVRRLPLARVYAACYENREEASLELDYPIIAYLACNEPHDVSMALKWLLRSKMIKTPSELLNADIGDRLKLGILFLRVCTSEVLDSLQPLDTVERVETERLTILNWVTKNVPEFSRMAENEVLRLTQDAELRGALQRIEEARVVLNLAALREAEQDRFTDAYFRYAAQRDLSSQVIEEAIKLVKSGEGPIVSLRTKLHQSQNAELAAFAGAFRDVRDAFLGSPHFGLEACLSGRIRHGFVVQHLRKPYVENKLAVSKETPEFAEIQQHWASRITGGNDHPAMPSIMELLSRLTQQIDTIAEEVKSVWMQAKTETRNPDGLFDYSYSDLELTSLLNPIVRDSLDSQKFLDVVFDGLVARTRTNLQRVRERVRGELLARLLAPTDRALGDISSLPESPALLPIKNAFAACRAEIERTCHEMTRWFEVSDSTLIGSDVGFKLVARTAIGMIERLNPSVRDRHQLDVKSSFRIRGRYFTALVHIVFFLLDNAVKHSRVQRERFLSKVEIEAESNSLTISVENNMESVHSAELAVDLIRQKAAELKKMLDPAKVVKEGGSGFAKIIAAVRYEFKQRDPTVTATRDGDRLRVLVKCEVAGLAV